MPQRKAEQERKRQRERENNAAVTLAADVRHSRRCMVYMHVCTIIFLLAYFGVAVVTVNLQF